MPTLNASAHADSKLLYGALEKLHTTSTGAHTDILQVTSLGIESSSTSTFVKTFEDELDRLAKAIVEQQETLERSAKTFLAKCIEDSITGDLYSSQSVRKDAEHLFNWCLQMKDAIADNKRELYKVAKKADMEFNTNCLALLDCKFASAPWKDDLNSVLVIIMSDIFDIVRSMENNMDGNGSAWEAPSSFERSTSKFWVEDDKLTDLLLTCAEQAPLLVYGKTGPLTSKEDLNSIEGCHDKLWTKTSSRISSVYFDSPRMDMYRERIRRSEGAQLFRVRWYGTKKPSGDKPVFLELKTHHEDWINTKSVKERVTILEKDMKEFLSRDKFTEEHAISMVLRATSVLEGDALTKAVDLLMTMHNLVVRYDLRPCVRSTYYRVAFQSPTSNSLRLTVDRNITLIDERSAFPGSWCLSDEAVIDPAMIVRVPYSVFELKLAGSEAPEPIEALKDRGVILDAAKFSKFLTGAAAFNGGNIDMLPYWAEDQAFASIFQKGEGISDFAILPNGQSKPASNLPRGFTPSTSKDRLHSSFGSVTFTLDSLELSSNEEETDRKATAPSPLANLRLFQSSRRSTSSSATKVASKKPARVEPKSFFANERTFIQWISAALLLVTISAILLDFQSKNNYSMGTALGLVGCALLIVLYAGFVYYRRIYLLTSGSSYGYIDHVGPLLLSASVVTGIMILLLYNIDVTWAPFSGIVFGKLIYQSGDDCFMRSTLGTSLLEYEPSDVYVDNLRDILVIPSLDRITAVSRSPNSTNPGVEKLIEIPGADLEGITYVGDRVFAICETGNVSELIELEWIHDDSVPPSTLTVANRWTIGTKGAEGVAYVPPTSSGGLGHLYVGGNKDSIKPEENGHIEIFEVPPKGSNTTSLEARHLNQNMLNKNLVDSKIGSLYYFEGLLYVLHDNDQVVRVWNVEYGTMLSEWQLPKVGNGSDKQWEGMALEWRDRHDNDGGENRGLRGSSNNEGSRDLILHLTLDTPAQIWSLRVQEGPTKGEIILPECAAR